MSKSLNYLGENQNFEFIVADLKDTISMLNQKCDDYEIQVNRLSFKNIRNSDYYLKNRKRV